MKRYGKGYRQPAPVLYLSCPLTGNVTVNVARSRPGRLQFAHRCWTGQHKSAAIEEKEEEIPSSSRQGDSFPPHHHPSSHGASLHDRLMVHVGGIRDSPD